MNDENVMSLTQDDSASLNTAYLVFYRRIDPNEDRPRKVNPDDDLDVGGFGRDGEDSMDIVG